MIRLSGVRAWIALVLAAITLFLAVWIVVPAPTEILLFPGIASPELSAWFVLSSLLTCLLVFTRRGLGTVARLVVACAVATTVLSLIPFVRFPFAARHADAAMRAGLGDDMLRSVAPEVVRAMRPRALVVTDVFHGFSPGDARITRDVEFAVPDGVPLRLDVYQPVGADDSVQRPIIVQIYGGAWQHGAPSADGAYARYFAARGYVVFAIDYRHAPRWQWPAQINDVSAALAWIRSRATAYGADSGRIVLVGRSSGAQLALLAAYRPGAPPVRGVVSFYGPTDLADGYRHPPRPDPLHVRPILESFLGGTPDAMPDRYRDASPITYANRPLPPTLLIYGGRDHIVEPRFGVMLYDRLRATGTTAVLIDIPWSEHAFDAVTSGPGAQLALYELERFIAWAEKG